MENWKWTLLIVFVRTARPSVGEKQRNSESLAWGCGTCGAVVDKRALPLEGPLRASRACIPLVTRVAFVKWSYVGNCRKLWTRLVFCFFKLSKCIIFVGPFRAPERGINTCAGGGVGEGNEDRVEKEWQTKARRFYCCGMWNARMQTKTNVPIQRECAHTGYFKGARVHAGALYLHNGRRWPILYCESSPHLPVRPGRSCRQPNLPASR